MTTTEAVFEQRKPAFYIKRIFGIILLLSLAAVFFFSAISKLYALDPFEWTFMDMGISSPVTASILAHLFIGLELCVGLFLLFHIYLKQVTYPATIVLLTVLTGYLIFLVAQQGNTGSCGCFGEWIYMKPVTAIWKNLLMMAATILLMFIYPIKPYKGQEWISALVGMLGLVAPFIIAPLDVNNQPKPAAEPISMELLYKPGKQWPSADLRTGKHIVAFMSLTCPHCKKAAYMLQIIKKHNPEIPIFLVLSGHPDNLNGFWKETHADAVPHLLCRDTEAFSELAGPAVPAIYWINNSVIEMKSNYYQLDPQVMKDWLKH